MCIQWTRVLYSIVITRQYKPPFSQFNSLCKLVKYITNKQTKSIIPTLIENKTTASTDQEKNEMLNNYFCQQLTLPDEKYQPLPN